MNGAAARRRAGWLAGVAIAAMVLGACDRESGDPSPTPTPSYSAPSPAPTATTDANGRALPGFVTVSAELPAAQTAPAGLLGQTGPGWSLQTYRPQVSDVTEVVGVTKGVPASVQVLYAVSPQGQRYQLLELDPALPIVVDSWTAGESVAYVRQCDPLDCDPTAPVQSLDLLTGALGPVDGIDDTLRIGATIAGSHRWWQGGASGSGLETAGRLVTTPKNWVASSVSPDGAYLAVVRGDQFSPYVSSGAAVVNIATGSITDISTLWVGPLDCTPFRWRVDDALDLSCYDPQDEKWRVITVGPGAQEAKDNKSATATPPAVGAWVRPDFFVSDGVWAGPFTADADARLAPETTQIGMARNAGFEQLVVPDATVGAARIVASVGGLLFVEAAQANNPSLTTAWTYDVAAATWTELGPVPPAGPTRGLLASEGSPASGLTSWAIAP